MIVSTLSSYIKQSGEGLYRLHYVTRDRGHSAWQREEFERLDAAVLRWHILLWQATGKMEGEPNIQRLGYYAR